MLIVHVLTRLLRAGAEENTIATCLGQVQAGHRVVLIYGAESHQEQLNKCSGQIELVQIPEMVHAVDPRRDFAVVRALRTWFRQHRPTIVHTHQSKAGILGRLAARWARVPIIIHGVHILPFHNVGAMQRSLYLTAERAIARFTTAYINVSEGTRSTCLKYSVGPAERHFVVHSGMNLQRFRNAQPPEDWRGLLGLSNAEPRPPILLMLATLEERKRHIAFIEALPRIIERVPNVLLLLAGEGPMRSRIEDVIARLGLAEHVRLLGYVDAPEHLIALADLSILTSEREGFPRVVVQSLAAGTPVVVTELPGLDQFIVEGFNGMIAPQDNFAHTADKVAALLTDTERLQNMRLNAANTDVSSWSTESMTDAMSLIYANALKQRGLPELRESGSSTH